MGGRMVMIEKGNPREINRRRRAITGHVHRIYFYVHIQRRFPREDVLLRVMQI